MEWKLSEEQADYQEALRGWLCSVATPERVRGWLYGDDARSFDEMFVRDGMAGVGVAEGSGGQGGGVVELALTAEELARAGVPSAGWLASMVALPALADEPDLVRAAVSGSVVTVLFSADGVPAFTDRVEVDDEGRASGSVAHVLAGGVAASFVAPAIDSSGTMSLRLVDATGRGVTTIARELLDRSRSVADVRLDGAPSAALDVDGTAVLERIVDVAGVLVAADALGSMERMLDLAVEYSLQRHQFGVPIGSFQAVKHAAASILVEVEAARSGVYYAAASVDSGHPDCALHAAAVKSQATAAASRAADTALTMHGAIGYTWEHDLHLFYKRARLDEALFGRPNVWNERLAGKLSLV